MNNRYMRRSIKKAALKILMIPLLVLLSFLAIRAGIIAGNLAYEADMKLVENIDTENFRSIINASLPIINTVYNSGNISVSVSGEIKGLIRSIFNFDLDTPLTILNVQSPLFYSYYNREYKSQLAQQDIPPAPESTPVPVAETPEPSPGNTAPEESATPETGNGTGEAVPTPEVKLKEPISSITYEEDENEEKEKSDIVTHGKIEIHNYTPFKINIEQLMNEPFNINLNQKGPQVLIYHTHTSESYVLKEKDLGKKGVAAYNKDPRYNVVRVGEELSRNLKKYGISVLHNGTVHDSNFPASYGASLKTLQKYVKSYPSLKVMFDIHRDGLGDGQKLRITTKVKGKTAAQVMFVVGTNGNGLPHPRWKENLKFAIRLQEVLNQKYPGLARPIFISKNRYNQQMSDDTLLIEIGGDGNLLSECLESTKYLAEAINIVINKK